LMIMSDATTEPNEDVSANESDEEVRYNVKMPKRLRDDAKRNTERGDLAKDVRKVFRRRAYGAGAVEEESKLDRAQNELEQVRERIEDLRRKRGRIQNEIESQERRATRLEERISSLEEERDEVEQAIQTLENMLQNGERMWPTRIKNATEFDKSTAEEIHVELKNRNTELPERAFKEPPIHEPNNWIEADN